MISVTVTVPQMPGDMGKAVSRSLWQSVMLVRREASIRAPYKTGTLRRSLVEKVYSNQGTVGTNVVYARIHEYGGVILPKKAKMLRFKINGKRVFAKKVRIRKKPYLVPALTENKDKITTIFASNVRDFLAGRL